MKLTEKAQYLKGLADGIKLGTKQYSEDPKIQEIGNILNSLLSLVIEITEGEATTFEAIKEIDSELEDIEECIYELQDNVFGTEDSDSTNEYAEEEMYEIICPKCENSLTFDFELLSQGKVIICPNCGDKIEFNADFIESDEDIEGY